jgi:hypothetical protein
MFISDVNNTGDKREKFRGINIFHILLGAFLSALYTLSTTPAITQNPFFTSVNDTG